MKTFGVVCGVVAWCVCFGAGVVILRETGMSFLGPEKNDQALSQGIGLYFIGKSFFVGPLLILTALRFSSHGSSATNDL